MTELQGLGLAQTTDIAAMVLARAGVPPAHGMQGQSLLPVMAGQTDALCNSVLIGEEGQRLDFNMNQRIRMRSLRTQLLAELAYAMLKQTNTSPYPLASA